MKKETASQILYKFNTPAIMDVLNLYIDERLDRLTQALEGASELITVRFLQGQISELRKLKEIRTHASQVIGVNR